MPSAPPQEWRLQGGRGLPGGERWRGYLQRWRWASRADPFEEADALVVLSWRPNTRRTYATHIKRIAEWHDNCDGWAEDAFVLERYLQSMYTRGSSKSAMRGAISAARAIEEMGWAQPFVGPRSWRMARSAIDEDSNRRPYGGLDALEVYARGLIAIGGARRQYTVFALSVLSFSCFFRVGEAAGLRRCGVVSSGLFFRSSKTSREIVHRQLGEYPRAWADWLVRYGTVSGILTGLLCAAGESCLQSELQRALAGTELEDHRWHCWRRGGAATLHLYGVPMEIIMWWGRWASRKVAADYCTPPTDFVLSRSRRLPWPVEAARVKWASTSIAQCWPDDISRHFRSEGAEVKQSGVPAGKRPREEPPAGVAGGAEDVAQPRIVVKRRVKVALQGGLHQVAGGAGASGQLGGVGAKAQGLVGRPPKGE